MPLAGQRLTAALSLLLITPNQRVSVDDLVEAVWGDRPPRSAEMTLQTHLLRLRRSLEPGHLRGRPFTTIVHEANGYRLVAAPSMIDSLVFEEAAETSRDLVIDGEHRRALDQVGSALQLWRGRPWSPHSDLPWAVGATTRLEEVRIQLQERQAECRIELGYAEQAVADLGLLVTQDPLRERLWWLQMLALTRVGRAEAALSAYRQVRNHLVEELGVEPGPQLRELHRRILTADPSLLPARSAPAVPVARQHTVNRLPHRRTPLHGRSQEVTQLRSLLVSTPLLTVTGAAGCGKTRVIVEAARGATEFRDGVCFVDLVAATDTVQVADVVAAALGLQRGGFASVEDALQEFCRRRRLLVILDGCDHVVEPVAALVDRLLTEEAAVSVAVTSRRPLGVEGEHVWTLQPLPTSPMPGSEQLTRAELLASDPALALFVERTAALGHPLIDTELPLAAQICAAVDGLPLAIELAAAQAPSFGLHEILDQVRADPSSLARIGGDERRTTLADLIEHSVTGLAPDHRRLHEALSLVPGPITAEAASAIGDLPADETRRLLAGLVQRSLVQPLGGRAPGRPSRFQQLSPIRAHAHATTRQVTAKARRRDTWVTDLVDQGPRLGDASSAEWYQRLDDDRSAVQSFLQHSLFDDPTPAGGHVAPRLGLYWYFRGLVGEWEHWTQQAIKSPATTDIDRVLAGLSLACALALAGRGDLAPPLVVAADSYPLRQLGRDHALLLGDGLFAVANTVRGTRDLPLGVQTAAGVRRLADHTHDPLHDLFAEIAALLTHLDTGDPGGLIPRAEAAHAHAVEQDNLYAAWMATAIRVTLALITDDPRTGLEWSVRGITHHLQLGVLEAAGTMTMHGLLLGTAGEHLEAAKLLAAARHQSRRSGMRWPRSTQVWSAVQRIEAKLTETERAQAQRLGQSLTLHDLLPGQDAAGAAP